MKGLDGSQTETRGAPSDKPGLADKPGLGSPGAEAGRPFQTQRVLELLLGAAIDLDRLDFAEADKTHVTVGRAAGDAIALRPGSGVRFGDVQRGPLSPGDVSSWVIPSPSDSSLRPGRTTLLRSGDSLFFELPDGRMGRLELHRAGSDGWVLGRDLAAPGQRSLPRPPGSAAATVLDPSLGTVVVRIPAVGDPESASRMLHILEREWPLGSGEWALFASWDAGVHEQKVQGIFEAPSLGEPLSPSAVARIRARRGFSDQAMSPPGAAIDIVAAGGDPELRRTAAERAVAGLIDPDFQVRLESSTALGLLGGEARAALAQALEGEEGLAQAARQRLRVLDLTELGGPNLGLRLREAAKAAAVADASVPSDRLGVAFQETPLGLVARDPLRRAAAILRMADQAEWGGAPRALSDTDSAAAFSVAQDCVIAAAWAAAMAELDPDPRVRQLSRFLTALRSQPSIGAFEAPVPGWFLHGKARNASHAFEPFTNPREPLPAHAIDLIYELSAREELGDRRIGPSLARIRAYLVLADARGDQVSVTPESGFNDYDSGLVELALRLVERAHQEPLVARKEELLGAVEALLPEPALTFAAWRENSDRRRAAPLGAPSGEASTRATGRREITLESADLAALEQTLLDLALDAGAMGSAHRVDVDILLPAGEYGEVTRQPRLLDVPASGIRILPETFGEKVAINAGFRSIGAVDFVLERVTVVHGAGQALTVMDGGHAVVIDSILKGKSRVIHIASGEVELYGCEALPVYGGATTGSMLQLMGGGKFSARGSILQAGSLFIGQGGGDIWLDRCVLDAADRPIVQGQLGGRLMARESLLRGDGAGLMSVETGMLAATVLEASFQPLGRGASGLRVSPQLFVMMGSREDADRAKPFALEPLPLK